MNRLIAMTAIFLLITPTLFVNYDVQMPKVMKEAEALEPITTRHACHQLTNHRNGTHELTSGLPCWIKGSPYTKWVMTAYSDRIEMANGLYGSMLNTSDSSNRVYDLYYHDLKSTEDWIVQYWNGNAWTDSGINSATPTISTVQNDTGIFVTSTRENSEIKLVIDYITLEGLPLKHSVELKNLGSEKEFRIIQSHQVIEGYYFDSGFGRTLLESSVTVTGNTIEFQYTNTTQIITEMQHSNYYRNATLTKTDYGIKADFLFGNAVNQTSLLLDEDEIYRLNSGETCSNTDQKCNKKGYGARWLASCSSAGDGCTIDTASSQRASQVSGTGAGQTWDLDDVGKEDGNRAYLWLTTFDVGNVTAGAEITDVTIGMGSDFKVNGAGASAINLDMHVVDNDSCSGIASLSANAGFSDNALGVSILTAPVVASNFNAGVQSTHVNLNDHANRYISQRTAVSANSTDDHLACIAFSQAGTDVGGTSSHRYHYNMDGPHMNITVTYSTEITMSIDVQDQNGHMITKGNLKVRSTEGGTTTYTACDDECSITATPDTTVTFAVQWNPSTNADGYVKIDVNEGSFANASFVSTHDEACSADCDIEISATIYRNTRLRFIDTNGQLRTPDNVTLIYTDNSTEKTGYSTLNEFESKGVLLLPMLGKGNSSVLRIKDVQVGANNVVTNGSVTITPTNSDQTFQHTNKVFLITFAVASGDGFSVAPSRFDVKLENQTAIKQLTDVTAIQMTNMSIIPYSLRYQGWSFIKNSTAFSLNNNTGTDLTGARVIPGSAPQMNANQTLLILAKYYKVSFQGKNNLDNANVSSAMTYTSTLANGTSISITSGTDGLVRQGINCLCLFGNGSSSMKATWNSLNVSKFTFNPDDTETISVTTQVGVIAEKFHVARDDSTISDVEFHTSNDTLRFTVNQNAHDAGEENLRIEIIDRTWANNAQKRFLNLTESETGFTFEDPLIVDAWNLNGETLVKYVLKGGDAPSSPGGGGGAGGAGGAGGSQRRQQTEVIAEMVDDVSAEEEEFTVSQLSAIGLVIVGFGYVAFRPRNGKTRQGVVFR